MNAPQLIMAGYLAFNLGVNMAVASAEDGALKKFFIQVVVTALMVAVLAWGGFWK